MPPIASEGLYRFAFSEDGPYGKALGLVREHAPSGLVLDLGCGYAAIAEHVVESGRGYVGVDRDPEALADLASRSIEGHVVDLVGSVDHEGPGALAARLHEVVAGRPVGAVLLLDALEHLPDTEVALSELGIFVEGCRRSGGSSTGAAGDGGEGQPAPLLVVSIPNVTHFDLGAKLVGGRWDVTPTGLLDRTHLQMFSEARLTDELVAHRWHECARDDVLLERSDQSFPEDHPLLVEGGNVHDLLVAIRRSAGPNADVNQFVRAYRHRAEDPLDRLDLLETSGAMSTAGNSSSSDMPADSGASPWLTVLTRTQGTRLSMLEDALTCLAAQTLQDFEVIVLVHDDSRQTLEAVVELVDGFDDGFSRRVRVEPVVAGSRSAPLNAGLGLARGRYVAVLDDDDLVTADWVEQFAAAAGRAPGRVVRSVCASRHVRAADPAKEAALGEVPVTLSRPVAEFAERFDPLIHFAVNLTPVMSFAVPRALVTELGLRFDDTLEVCEDWDFLLRAALLVGVEDTGVVTAIYQRWEDDGAEAGAEAFRSAHEQMIRGLDAAPLLLGAGTASEIARLLGDPDLAVERAAVQAVNERHRAEVAALGAEVAALRARAERAEAARDEVLSSEFWRLTAPLRVAVTRLRAARAARRPPA